MKTTLVSTVILFTLLLIILLPRTAAVDTAKLPLPEGAVARLGEGIINSITYSHDGNILAAGSSVGIYLYDVRTNEELAFLPNHSPVFSVSFSPDGNTIATGSGNGLRMWDVNTLTEKAMLTENAIWDVSFSPDGKTIASSGKGLHLWDVETGTEKATLITTGDVYSVSFSPDGKTIASGDEFLRLWDVETGTEKARLTTDGRGDVSFSPDGKTIASTGGYFGGDVRLWDVETGTEKATLTGNPNDIYNVSFSPDGKTIAICGTWVGGKTQIQLWDVATLTEKVTLELRAYGTRISFSPDGKTIASGGINGARLWDVETGTEKATLTGNYTRILSFSPDGRTIATSGWDAQTWSDKARLWDVETRTEKATLTGYPVSFSPDGKTIATSGDWDSTDTVRIDAVRLWDIETGEEKSTFIGDSALINSIAFSPDGKTIATGGLKGVRLLHIPTETYDRPRLQDGSSNQVVSFSPDGKTIASTNPPYGFRLWDVDIGTERATLSESKITFKVSGHPGYLEFLVFSPDGKLIATGGWDGIVRLWDVETGEEKSTFTGHTGWVNSISFSSDGKTLASGSEDGTVLLWKLTPAQSEIERHPADVNGDGLVNIQDLVLVSLSFGRSVPEEGNPADVNGDGQINIVDLVKVAGALGTGTSAPSVLNQNLTFALTRAEVQQWLTHAQEENLTDAVSLRGIRFLEELLAALTPKETALLPNYPNPFNPETWIPYQLATPADVNISIYAANGTLVHTLDLGHQPVGIYQERNRAAHWDGKNALGEAVASGIYFYTLKAGDFSATRKMLIRK